MAAATQSSAVVSPAENVERAIVFISYAREDKDFVLRLNEALQLKGVDVRGDCNLSAAKATRNNCRISSSTLTPSSSFSARTQFVLCPAVPSWIAPQTRKKEYYRWCVEMLASWKMNCLQLCLCHSGLFCATKTTSSLASRGWSRRSTLTSVSCQSIAAYCRQPRSGSATTAAPVISAKRRPE